MFEIIICLLAIGLFFILPISGYIGLMKDLIRDLKEEKEEKKKKEFVQKYFVQTKIK